MIHRQPLPPQLLLLQHINKNLLSKMETGWRSQSILCGRFPDVRCHGVFPRMVRVVLQHRSSRSDRVAAGIFSAPWHWGQVSSTEL